MLNRRLDPAVADAARVAANDDDGNGDDAAGAIDAEQNSDGGPEHAFGRSWRAVVTQ